MTKVINILFVISFLLLYSCNEEYWPELNKYENLIAVDGSITNEPGPYKVTLSYSTSVQNPEFIPYSGAEVIITDGEGTSELLTETAEGIYLTKTDGIQGVIGQEYKLTVIMPGNKYYESDYQTLLEPVNISNVYGETMVIQTEDEYYPIYGYQFYLDTEPAVKDTNYLFWRMEGDYKYTSDFLIRYYYDKRKLSVFPKADSLYTCYGKDKISGLNVMSTENLTIPQITKLPLNFVDTETRKLSIRYSLLVKQFTLVKEAFDYFSAVKDLNSQDGALYTQQPYQIRGNVYNSDNPSDNLLGYFFVAGIDTKRIYVDRPFGIEYNYGVCELSEGDYDAYGYIRWTDAVSWPLYVTTNPDGRRALTHQECVDCRLKGGQINKPDFWED